MSNHSGVVLRILHVTREATSDTRYGIRKSFWPVAEVLKSRGHVVDVVDQNSVAGVAPGSVAKFLERTYLHALRRRYGQHSELYLQFVRERIEVCWSAAQLVRRSGPAHVHCHDPLLGYIYDFFARILRLEGRWGYSLHSFGRYVQQREGIALPARVAVHLQSWESTAAGRAAWIVSPSRSGLEQMAWDLGVNTIPDCWHVVPHPRPICSPAVAVDIRKEFDIGNNVLLLAVGQLIPIKRFGLLLQAVARLPHGQQPHIIILGEGPEEGALRSLAEQLGIGMRLHITATSRIADYLAAADIYVSTSSTESYGMANCEALAAGLPSICCAVGAVPEVVADGACMTGETVEEISRHLSRLIASPEERNQLRDKALARAAWWWSAERVADAMEDIYAAN